VRVEQPKFMSSLPSAKLEIRKFAEKGVEVRTQD
jgi:hypothetical protein